MFPDSVLLGDFADSVQPSGCFGRFPLCVFIDSVLLGDFAYSVQSRGCTDTVPLGVFNDSVPLEYLRIVCLLMSLPIAFNLVFVYIFIFNQWFMLCVFPA